MSVTIARARALLSARTFGATYVSTVVFWSPLIAGAITVALGATRHFLANWLTSLAIAEVVATTCFAGVWVFRRVEMAVYRRRGRDAPVHTWVWYMLLSASFWPVALPLGFAAGGVAARALGFTWRTPDFGSYRSGVGFGIVCMVVVFAQRSRHDAKEAAQFAEARIKDLEAARLRAQLAALTAEMNPHLLFNALNTVASLIHTDPDRAEDVVLQLSELYRGVLQSSGATTHSLRAELGLCHAYLAIEQARFGDRLSVDVQVDPGMDTGAIDVPVLLLQPFVENAVKHGISPRAQGGRIRLGVRLEDAGVGTEPHHGRSCVIVSIDDDGVGLGNSRHEGAGKAMSNCKDRLTLTYGEAAHLEIAAASGGGTRVKITMPLAPASGTRTGIAS